LNERTIQDPRPLNGLMALLARIAVCDEGTGKSRDDDLHHCPPVTGHRCEPID